MALSENNAVLANKIVSTDSSDKMENSTGERERGWGRGGRERSREKEGGGGEGERRSKIQQEGERETSEREENCLCTHNISSNKPSPATSDLSS